MRICTKCGKEKEDEAFNFRYKPLGVRHHICVDCQREYKRKSYENSNKDLHRKNVRERNYRVREEAKEFVYQYLLTHPCEECGESDPRVLEFHHIGEKERAISEMVARGTPISKIEEEIRNCRVLCANDHRKLTMKEKGWFRGRK